MLLFVFLLFFFTFALNPHYWTEGAVWKDGGWLWNTKTKKQKQNCSHFRWEDFKADACLTFQRRSCIAIVIIAKRLAVWVHRAGLGKGGAFKFSRSLEVRQSSCSAAAQVLRWVRAKTFDATCVSTGQRCAVAVNCWALDPVHIFQLLSAAFAVFCPGRFSALKVFSLAFHLRPRFHFHIVFFFPISWLRWRKTLAH